MASLFNDDWLNEILQNEFFDFNVGFKPEREYEVRRCPVCKQSFMDIQKRGRVGCAECYKFFAEQLLPTIKRLQACTTMQSNPLDFSGVEHSETAESFSAKEEPAKVLMGTKDCTNEQSKSSENTALEKLNLELKEAVKQEDYRRAAELKRKIEGLGHKTSDEGGEHE